MEKSKRVLSNQELLIIQDMKENILQTTRDVIFTYIGSEPLEEQDAFFDYHRDPENPIIKHMDDIEIFEQEEELIKFVSDYYNLLDRYRTYDGTNEDAWKKIEQGLLAVQSGLRKLYISSIFSDDVDITQNQIGFDTSMLLSMCNFGEQNLEKMKLPINWKRLRKRILDSQKLPNGYDSLLAVLISDNKIINEILERDKEGKFNRSDMRQPMPELIEIFKDQYDLAIDKQAFKKNFVKNIDKIRPFFDVRYRSSVDCFILLLIEIGFTTNEINFVLVEALSPEYLDLTERD